MESVVSVFLKTSSVFMIHKFWAAVNVKTFCFYISTKSRSIVRLNILCESYTGRATGSYTVVRF